MKTSANVQVSPQTIRFVLLMVSFMLIFMIVLILVNDDVIDSNTVNEKVSKWITNSIR
jgi:hypothetical protein